MIRIVAPVVAALIATAPTARAQTWRWHYVLRVPNGPPVNAQSTVQVAGDRISLTYSATIRRRDVVIASCRAALQDVDRASAFRSEGRVFFLVRLRADRAAACDSGPKAAAAVPGSDFAELSRIADAVNRALPPPAVASRNGPTHSLPAGSDASPAVVPDVPARLLTRGTSELAIGHAGVARVRVTVAADGTPQDASILSVSDRRLAAAAIAAAVASTYAPATKDGKPVAAPYVGTFTFTGEDPATAAIPIWRRSPLPAPLPTETPTPAPTPTATATPTATPSPTPVPTPMPTVRPRRTPDTLEPIRWFPSRRSTPRPTPTPTPVPTPTATATPTPLPPAPAASAPASGAR